MRPPVHKVKFVFDSELRVIRLTKELNLLELLSSLEEVLKIERNRLSLKYEDDEREMITITSQVEFEEALRCMQIENECLKIYVERRNPTAEAFTRNYSYQVTEVTIAESIPFPLEEKSSSTLMQQSNVEVLQTEEVEVKAEPSVLEEHEADPFETTNQEVQQSIVKPVEKELVSVDTVPVTESNLVLAQIQAMPKKKSRKGRKKKAKLAESIEIQREEERVMKPETLEKLGKLKEMKDNISFLTQQSKQKIHYLKSSLKEEEGKKIQLIKSLEESILEKKRLIRHARKESRNEIKDLKKEMEALEVEIEQLKVKEKEEEKIPSKATVHWDFEEKSNLQRQNREKKQKKKKFVRFEDEVNNSFLFNQRDKEEEMEHFEEQMTMLFVMGFQDEDRCLYLLRKHQGDVGMVANELLAFD